MNRTLRRQLDRINREAPERMLDALLEVVDATYDQHDRDRRHGDRANALMADELTEMAAIRERAILLESEKFVAEEASRAKSQFLANMSHELRTPLNAIIGYSELLCESADDHGRHADVSDHKRILNAARHLLALINEVLDLSKIEAGKMTILPELFDPRACASEVVEAVTKSAESSGNQIHVEVCASVDFVYTDELRLSQCVLNLLANAVKFTQNGDIYLRMRTERTDDDAWLVCEVVDTGIGISPEQLQKLFQPFSQADESTTRTFGGTGLGLTITRRIAHLLGGDITLVSAPGRGTTATLRIPTGIPSKQFLARTA
jgi:prepilin-type processing-associated H-X9-DG protein